MASVAKAEHQGKTNFADDPAAEAMRAKGLRPVTFWVPDTRDPAFVAEYRRQRQAIAESARANPAREAEYWDWADAVQADEGWV